MSLSHVLTNAVFRSSAKARWLPRLLARIVAANDLHRQHCALLHLDDALLRDVGITRDQAISMATRPVWNAPNHWKC